MPTVRTVTVKSSGGDYTSLAAAEAGEQGDLVALDRQLDIECYSFQDTAAVTIDGWTTDATRYIRIFTPADERHAGVWNTGKYRLVVSNTDALSISENYVRVEGLQIHTLINGGFQDGIQVLNIAAGGSDIRIDSCIVRQFGGATFNEICIYVGDADATVTIRNTIAYGSGTVGSNTSALWAQAGTVTGENCTFASGSLGVAGGGTVSLTNCYAAAPTPYLGTISRTTCAHSTAGVFAGSTASIAHDTTNFTNVTAGSEDYHLVSGASATLLTGGTDLSGTFTTDIDGQTRSDWGIGADEFVSGGQTVVVGLASETDTALALTANKTKAVGLVTETDTGLAVTAKKTRAVGLASETDAALTVTARKTKTLGLAAESDTAFGLTIRKALTVGQAVESDQALAVTASGGQVATDAYCGLLDVRPLYEGTLDVRPLYEGTLEVITCNGC